MSSAKTSTKAILRRSLSILALAATLSACDTPLRSPICQQDEMEFPVGAEGRYRFSILTSSAQYSGSYADLTVLDFSIKDWPDNYEVEMSRKAPAAIAKALKRPSPLPFDDSDDPIGGQPIMPIKVCRIGSNYYVQNETGDGTFTVQRFDLSPTGITTTSLAWHPVDLDLHGFKYHFAPQLSDFVEGKGFSFDSLQPTKLIVDNVDLTPERREQLISLGHPTVAGMVYSRIGPLLERTDQPRPGMIRFRIAKK